ncbi:MAG: RDD family protein [Lentisphaeria bacterium]|nr:RDD family protein [Lentisphaeria bacterium]
MEWYYSDNDEQRGPIGDQEFAALVEDGTITSETLVWNATMDEWQAHGTLQDTPAVGQQFPGAEQDTCAECGRIYASEDLIELGGRLICGPCKPVVVQQLREGVASLGGMRFAGFWIRVGAKLIDGIIIGAVNMMIQVVFVAALAAMGTLSGESSGFNMMALLLTFVRMGIQICLGAAFTTYFLGKFGATPGKMVCGLKVVRADGSKLSYGRGCGRHFADMLNGFTAGLLYLMVVFDEERRGLHDRICDTRVVHK